MNFSSSNDEWNNKNVKCKNEWKEKKITKNANNLWLQNVFTKWKSRHQKV